jgi:2-amino-4-hydroxy-6-hydroxymethyldihydropteridine diphosphokinase
MLKNVAFLELGGNMGNRKELINKAIAALTKKCSIIARSSIYETAPWGFTAENNFYNQVIKIKTDLNPVQLLKVTQNIETKLGRVRTDTQYISRTMDIDILFFNNDIIENKILTIPHPQIHRRKFVLIPLHEIEPDFIHPQKKITVTDMLNQCTDTSECKKQTSTKP